MLLISQGGHLQGGHCNGYIVDIYILFLQEHYGNGKELD